MALFFFFEDNRLNLMVYFTVSTLVLYLGPSFFMASQSSEVPIVSMDLGKMRGDLLVSAERGRAIFAYKGLPYAEPPIGQLRFARPKPWSQKWEGIRDATVYGSMCTQEEDFMGYQQIKGSEDCLYLNVYVPKSLSNDELLPVMVYIHGGGFAIGDGSDTLHGPQRLLDRDVVLVTLNYRLGPLGFFTLNSDEAQGNQGLWDQVEALRWVQRYIKSFGGDPNRVTIFGNSAGGSSVSALLVSKAVFEEKLIHGAIPQSGSLHMPFAGLDNRGSVVPYHEQYAHHLGCQSEDRKELIKCLQQLPATKLVSESHLFDNKCNFLPAKIPYLNPWSPSTDHTFSSHPFFEGDRRQLMKSGKAIDVPVMMGFTKDDGLISAAPLYNNPQESKEGLEDDSKEMKLTKLVEDFYYGSQVELPLPSFSEEPFFSGYTKIITDGQFAFGAHTMAKGLVSKGRRKSPVFYFRLDHLGSFSTADTYGLNKLQQLGVVARKALGYHSSARLGVCHVDENLHLFKLGFPMETMVDARDLKMHRFMVDLWINFATFGTPTPDSTPPDVLSDAWKAKRRPKWPKVDEKDVRFVRLDNSQINLDIKEDTDDQAYERLAFWTEKIVSNLPYMQ